MLFNDLSLYRQILHELPVASAILGSSNFILDTANRPMLELLDRSASVVGLPLMDFMPELVGQPYPELLARVLTTKTSHSERGARMEISRYGKMETIFLDYSYTPIQLHQRKPAAILVTAVDVSQREKDKSAQLQNQRDLQALVKMAPAPMCLFMGQHFEIDSINDAMLELWKSHRHMGLKALKYVFHQGIPYSSQIDRLVYTYTPVRDGLGNPKGVILLVGTIDKQ